ncbi:MAG: sigma-70 family RNA polymerase sigma factor [Sphingobium sp.]
MSSERIALYRDHRVALVNYARTILGNHAQAEDVVQEAWVRLEGAAADRPVDDPLRYLYRIVRNLALDVMRRSRFEQTVMGMDVTAVADILPDDRPSPEARLSAAREYETVIAALRELPERTRIAFEMHRLGGYKLKEIAVHLDISMSLVHLLISQAIAHCSERRDPRL